MDFVLILLLIISLVSAASAVFHPNLMYAVLSLLVFNIILAIVYYALSAPFVAVFQLAVFAGAIIVFFIVTVTLTRGGMES